MNKNYKIAVVTILYNPYKSCIANIYSYLDKVNKIYLVDNSETQNPLLFSELQKYDNIVYLWNKRNIGIGESLNKAASRAIKENFDFLLMMDQDSEPEPNMVDELTGFVSNEDISNIGIISASPRYYNFELKKMNEAYQEQMVTITSGSLLNLNAYKEIGGFRNDFFIDYIDFEYCLRLNANGYKILKLKNASFMHNLGKIESRKLFFREISITHHSSVRIYYRTRNRFYVNRKYFLKFPGFVLKDLMIFFNEFIKIIFFEKDKIKKIKMIFLGFNDFRKNKMGIFAH